MDGQRPQDMTSVIFDDNLGDGDAVSEHNDSGQNVMDCLDAVAGSDAWGSFSTEGGSPHDEHVQENAFSLGYEALYGARGFSAVGSEALVVIPPKAAIQSGQAHASAPSYVKSAGGAELGAHVQRSLKGTENIASSAMVTPLQHDYSLQPSDTRNDTATMITASHGSSDSNMANRPSQFGNTVGSSGSASSLQAVATRGFGATTNDSVLVIPAKAALPPGLGRVHEPSAVGSVCSAEPDAHVRLPWKENIASNALVMPLHHNNSVQPCGSQGSSTATITAASHVSSDPSVASRPARRGSTVGSGSSASILQAQDIHHQWQGHPGSTLGSSSSSVLSVQGQVMQQATGLQLQSLNNALQECQDELQMLRRKLDEERQKNERLARVAEHQKKIDNEMLEGVKGERDELRSKLQSCEKEMSLLQEQLLSVRTDLHSTVQRAQLAEAAKAELQQHLQETQSLSLTRQQNDYMASLESLRVQHRNQLSSLREEVETTRSQLQEERRSVCRLEGEISQVSAELQQACKDRDEAIRQVELLQVSKPLVSSVTADSAELVGKVKHELESVYSAQEKAEQELKELHAEHNQLVQEIRNLPFVDVPSSAIGGTCSTPGLGLSGFNLSAAMQHSTPLPAGERPSDLTEVAVADLGSCLRQRIQALLTCQALVREDALRKNKEVESLQAELDKAKSDLQKEREEREEHVRRVQGDLICLHDSQLQINKENMKAAAEASKHSLLTMHAEEMNSLRATITVTRSELNRVKEEYILLQENSQKDKSRLEQELKTAVKAVSQGRASHEQALLDQEQRLRQEAQIAIQDRESSLISAMKEMYEQRLQSSVEERLMAACTVWEKESASQKEKAILNALQQQRHELEEQHQVAIEMITKQQQSVDIERLSADVWHQLQQRNETGQELKEQCTANLEAVIAKVRHEAEIERAALLAKIERLKEPRMNTSRGSQTENGPVLVGEVKERLQGELVATVKELVRAFVQEQKHRSAARYSSTKPHRRKKNLAHTT